MKRIGLILLAVCALAAPIFVIAQSKAAQDSSARKHLQRARLLQQDAEKEKKLVGRAEIAAEKAKLKAHKTRLKAHVDWQDLDFELADIEPAIAEALEGVEPAMEQARAALENIDWGGINEAMQEASAAMAEMPGFPPMPDMPLIPDIPHIAGIPPMPALAPMPHIPPMPNIRIGPGRSFGLGRSWGFSHNEYTKNLSDDEQVHLQALAALLDRDENAALPEIKRLARQHENWALRAAGVALLADSESSEVIAILEEALNKDSDQRVRKAAVHALSCREEPEAREVLKRLLQK